MWQVNACAVTASGRFVGSVLYEEYGSDEIILNFMTAQMSQNDETELDYP